MADKENYRSDSVLGNLAEDRQEQIAQWIKDCQEGDRYEFARTQLAADGLKVSRTAVQNWYRGWRLRRRLSSVQSFSSKVQDALKALNLGLTTEQLDTAGQLVFTDMAMEAEDPELFEKMEYLRVTKQTAKFKAEIEREKLKLRQQAEKRAERKLKLEREKFRNIAIEKILDGAMRKKAEEIATSNAPRSEQIELLGRAIFKEDWDD